MDCQARRRISWKYLLEEFERPCRFAAPGSCQTCQTAGYLVTLSQRSGTLISIPLTKNDRRTTKNGLSLLTASHVPYHDEYLSPRYRPQALHIAHPSPNILDILNPISNTQPYNLRRSRPLTCHAKHD